MNTPVPDCIVYFFSKNSPTNMIEGKYIHLGLFTKKGFDTLDWRTKVLGSVFSPEKPEHHHVFVEVSEVVIHILGNGLDDCMLGEEQRQEVLEYAKKAGIEIPDDYLAIGSSQDQQKKPVKKKPARKSKSSYGAKSEKPEHDPIDLYHGKIETIKQIVLEESVQLRTPSGSKSLDLLPGKHLFALIDSPLEHEKGKVLWLVLENQLPVVYGKTVSTWEMILGRDPLSS